MVTSEERATLLSHVCPWCSATVGEECYVRETGHTLAHRRGTSARVPITTLDGGFHDARHRAALGRPARVTYVPSPTDTPERPTEAEEGPGRVPVAVGGERPW